MRLETTDHQPISILISMWGIFTMVRHLETKLNTLIVYLPVILNSIYPFSDHRWTLHSERVQPADFENSPVNHLTELQSVSPQQLTQPFRYSTEALPLHLDPPLLPLSMSPQVSAFNKCMCQSHSSKIITKC